MNDKMSQAIAAARSGQSQKAQVLLAQILKDDQANINAWFLLSHLVDAPKKKTAFLKRVLALDPQHTQAQNALTELEKPPVVETPPVPEPEPITEPEPKPTPIIEEALPEIEEQETAYNLDEPQAQEIPAPITSFEEEDLLSQAEGGSLPDWLTTEEDDVLTPEDLAAEALPDFTDSVAIEDLPDWLTKTNIEDWTAEKPWEQAESSIDIESDVEESVETEPEPEPEPIKSVIDVAAESPAPDLPLVEPKPAKRSSDRTLSIVFNILIILAALVIIGLLYLVISSL